MLTLVGRCGGGVGCCNCGGRFGCGGLVVVDMVGVCGTGCGAIVNMFVSIAIVVIVVFVLGLVFACICLVLEVFSV